MATRLAFLAAGFAMSCWAPIVPFAKARVGADDSQLGLILLCLGVGSLIAMPLTGWLSTRLGSRPVIVVSGLGAAVLLPLLPAANSTGLLAIALLGFGAAIGTLDVSMNTHAVEVERMEGRPLMSGFHAMFSVGGILGAGSMTFLLSTGMTAPVATLIGGGLTLVAIAFAWPRLLPARGTPAAFALPHGFVMLIAGLSAVAFLVEGAILDWGALVIIDAKLAPATQGGLGYMLFSIAMSIGRLTGDRVVADLGNYRTLFWGGWAAVAGFAVLLVAPAPVALGGFFVIGLGAANLVPVLFRLAGNQTVMPAAMAVAAVTTIAYAGILVGPAAIGFVADAVGLRNAFWLLAALMGLIPLLAKRSTRA